MNLKLSLSLVLVSLAVVSIAQTADPVNYRVLSFTAGGVSIKIPAPDTSFAEVGSENRESMNVLVPQSNRLLCAFVLKDDLPHLFKDDNNAGMSKYAMVEVPRSGENMDCEAADFKQVVESVNETFNESASSLTKETEDEFNRRMRSMDLADLQIKLGEPTQLGRFFSKDDIIGLGMLMGYEMGGSTIKMGMTVILMRVKKRLLYVYLYAQFKDDETIVWLRNVGEKWSDEILKVNKL